MARRGYRIKRYRHQAGNRPPKNVGQYSPIIGGFLNIIAALINHWPPKG